MDNFSPWENMTPDSGTKRDFRNMLNQKTTTKKKSHSKSKWALVQKLKLDKP